MSLLTTEQREVLIQNGIRVELGASAMDLQPVVKLFFPVGAATWLLAYIVPDDHNIAWGLADLGIGLPETGDIFLPELEAYRGRYGLEIERDLYFKADKTMRQYTDDAIKAGRIET